MSKKTFNGLPILILLLIAILAVSGYFLWQHVKGDPIQVDNIKPVGDCEKMCAFVASDERVQCITSCQKMMQNVESNPEIKINR